MNRGAASRMRLRRAKRAEAKHVRAVDPELDDAIASGTRHGGIDAEHAETVRLRGNADLLLCGNCGARSHWARTSLVLRSS